jgi:hypothetical protein
MNAVLSDLLTPVLNKPLIIKYGQNWLQLQHITSEVK